MAVVNDAVVSGGAARQNITEERVTLNGGEAIVRVLRAAGVCDAFGLASGKLAPLFKALSEERSVRYVGVRHEAAAAFMATAIFAASGRMAVCLGETGPGGLNLLSGLGGASANNLAVLAITSSNPASLLSPNRGAFSSSDNERLYRPLMKWNATARHVSRIPELVRRAIRTALTGQPGPVHLDVPADVLNGTYSFSCAELDAPLDAFRVSAPVIPVRSALESAAELLSRAKRPLLVAGGGAVRSVAAEGFRALLDRLPALAMTTQMGLGIVPTDHPRFIGQGGFAGGEPIVRALAEADVILAVGCRFSSYMWTEGAPQWCSHPHRALIQIDIDPERIGETMPVTVGLQGDAAAVLDELASLLPARPTSSTWIAAIQALRSDYLGKLDALADTQGPILHPATLAREIGRLIRGDDFVVFDGGHTSFWSNDFTPVLEPGRKFHEPGMAHLGFGLPWAIALALRYPRQRSFCVTGDGAFGFTLQELDTARRMGAKVVTIIHNNSAWGVIEFAQKLQGFDFGTDLGGTDYATIARGFGCHGRRIETVAEFGDALEEALAFNGPAVIDARVGFAPHPIMPIFARSTAG